MNQQIHSTLSTVSLLHPICSILTYRITQTSTLPNVTNCS